MRQEILAEHVIRICGLGLFELPGRIRWTGIKGETTTDLPEFELGSIDIAKHMGVLLYHRFLQVANRSTLLDVDRKRTSRLVENPTEELHGGCIDCGVRRRRCPCRVPTLC